jgi:protein phosphatase
MQLKFPEPSLVVLIGSSSAGKSTFARQHFRSTEILSSDYCRSLVSDDENDQSVTAEAFEILHFIAAKRLAAGRLTVVDATNVQAEARQPLLNLARQYDYFAVAIVLNVPEQVCVARHQQRRDRHFDAHVIRQHQQDLRRSLRSLEQEGFHYTYILNSLEEIRMATIERQSLRLITLPATATDEYSP